jgi:hypothetical protein
MYDEEIIFDTPTNWKKDGVLWSHLGAKNIGTLKRFAVSIGLKPQWFQISASGKPHFDIKSDRIRELALKKGAKQVDLKYFHNYMEYHFPNKKVTMSVYPFSLPA